MAHAIRWGILGTGEIAARFAEGLAATDGRLVAVASRTASKGSAFAKRFGGVKSHIGYEALAQDPEVDVVYVATPNSDHRASTLLCIEAGKAVLCEKPFARTADEAREMIEAARKKRVFLMEAMWTRFVPAVRELVLRVRGGALGDLRMASLELGHPFDPQSGHRVFDAATGGGALLDLGVYPLSLAFQLFGPPIRMQSQAVLHTNGVDTQVTALLGHEGGRQSLIAASILCRMANAATIMGTDGWATLAEPLYRPEAFTIAKVAKMGSARGDGSLSKIRQSSLVRGARGAARRVRAVLPAGLRARFGGGGQTLAFPCEGNGYHYEADEVMRCMKSGALESAIMPLDETLRIMQTVDEIRRGWTVI